MMRNFLFTSESVTEGHPDKICDQISDAVVDHLLSQDPYSRVRAECAISSAIVFIAARFRSEGNIDFTRLARKVIRQIGYDRPDFNARICSILTSPQALPVNTADRFDEQKLSAQEIDAVAVQNQVNVFGYACNQSPAGMPLPIFLAHRLSQRLSRVRHTKELPYLEPDGRVQVGIVYENRRPQSLHSINITAGQDPRHAMDQKRFREEIFETVIRPAMADAPLPMGNHTLVAINPEGAYTGGPTHHSGLTGRKNAIDTYGEFSRHSGKALSGKDPLRIDRTGAYAARHAAKNIVAAGLAEECELMLSYSIGHARPVSMVLDTFGTGRMADSKIGALVEKVFDFRLAGILKNFRLRHLPAENPGGLYQKLASYGHFGRQDMEVPWEKTDKAALLAQA